MAALLWSMALYSIRAYRLRSRKGHKREVRLLSDRLPVAMALPKKGVGTAQETALPLG